jgi:hypothetical protein
MIVTTTNLFAVRSALPVKSIDELVAYAKSNPGKLNHGASLGVPPHLLGEFVRAKTGIEMPYVPYRSTAAAIPDFLSGQIQATSESSSVMLPHIQAGAARALVVAGTKRLPELPDVPTLAEAGLSGFPDEVWMGSSHLGARPRRSSSGSTAPSTKLCDPRRRGRPLPGSDSKRGPDRCRSLRPASRATRSNGLASSS